MINTSSAPALLYSKSDGFHMNENSEINGNMRCHPQMLWFQSCACSLSFSASQGFALDCLSADGDSLRENIPIDQVLSIVALGDDQPSFEIRYKDMCEVVVKVFTTSSAYERNMWCLGASRELFSSLFHWLTSPLLRHIFSFLDTADWVNLRSTSVQLWRVSRAKEFRSRSLLAPHIWRDGRFALPKTLLKNGVFDLQQRALENSVKDDVTFFQVIEGDVTQRASLRSRVTEHPMDPSLICGVAKGMHEEPGSKYRLEIAQGEEVVVTSQWHHVPDINSTWSKFLVHLSAQQITCGDSFTVSVSAVDGPEVDLLAEVTLVHEVQWVSDSQYSHNSDFVISKDAVLPLGEPSVPRAIRQPMCPGKWYVGANGAKSNAPLRRSDCAELLIEPVASWSLVRLSVVDPKEFYSPGDPITLLLERPADLAFNESQVIRISEPLNSSSTTQLTVVPGGGAERLTLKVPAPRSPDLGYVVSLATTQFRAKRYHPICTLERRIDVKWPEVWDKCSISAAVLEGQAAGHRVCITCGDIPSAQYFQNDVNHISVLAFYGTDLWTNYWISSADQREMTLPAGTWRFVLKRGNHDILSQFGPLEIADAMPMSVEPTNLDLVVETGGISPKKFQLILTDYSFQQAYSVSSYAIKWQIRDEMDPNWICFIDSNPKDNHCVLRGSSDSFNKSGRYTINKMWGPHVIQKAHLKVYIQKTLK